MTQFCFYAYFRWNFSEIIPMTKLTLIKPFICESLKLDALSIANYTKTVSYHLRWKHFIPFYSSLNITLHTLRMTCSQYHTIHKNQYNHNQNQHFTIHNTCVLMMMMNTIHNHNREKCIHVYL